MDPRPPHIPSMHEGKKRKKKRDLLCFFSPFLPLDLFWPPPKQSLSPRKKHARLGRSGSTGIILALSLSLSSYALLCLLLCGRSEAPLARVLRSDLRDDGETRRRRRQSEKLFFPPFPPFSFSSSGTLFWKPRVLLALFLHSRERTRKEEGAKKRRSLFVGGRASSSVDPTGLFGTPLSCLLFLSASGSSLLSVSHKRRKRKTAGTGMMAATPIVNKGREL